LVLAIGSVLATPLAAGLEALPFAGAFFLIPGLRDDFPFGGGPAELGQFLFGPLGPLVILEFVLLAPLSEELLKPLGVYLAGRQLTDVRQAFLLGMVAGASFAIMENVAYLSLLVDERGPSIGNAFLRIASGPVHPFASGLVAAGYHRWRNGREGEAFVRYLGMAVSLHGLWNAVAGALLLLGVRLGANPSAVETTPAIGAAASVLLLCLVAGGMLLWASMPLLVSAVTGTGKPMPLQLDGERQKSERTLDVDFVRGASARDELNHQSDQQSAQERGDQADTEEARPQRP
jgi:hypothetical protein